MGTPPGWSAAAYVATSRNAPVEPEAQSREVSTQGMSKPCESRTGFEPAPPAWEAGMLTVDDTGTGGCGTVSTRHAPARDRACDGPHPSAFDGIRTRGLPLRRRAPYPLGHEGEREAPDPRADWTRPPRCPVGWGRGRGRPPANREHARRGGVEPPLTVLETVVLPLDHRRRRGTDRRISPADV